MDQAFHCPYFHTCGGCQLLELPYPRQLEEKQRRAEALLGGFGPVLPILGMEQPLHYRSKLVRSFGLDKKRRPVCGIYRPGSHVLVPVEGCLLEDPVCAAIARDIFSMLPAFKIPVYDERSGVGFLRHLLLRRSFATGQVLLVLVAASPLFKAQKPFLQKLLRLHPEISTVLLNINDRFGPVILGSREKLLYGPGTIEEQVGGLRFLISARAFFQVNPVQTEKLYAAALDFASLTGEETVLDAYCGVGSIGITAAPHAKQVLGIELNRDAVQNAIANARLNGLKNLWFTAGDAGEAMERLAAEGHRTDLVFMDPPRAGSDARFLSSLLRAAPARVVYISCDPETLKRDLSVLQAGGYRIRRIQPVDMFPFTGHLEAVTELVRERSSARPGRKGG